jgi:hypothetical protein
LLSTLPCGPGGHLCLCTSLPALLHLLALDVWSHLQRTSKHLFSNFLEDRCPHQAPTSLSLSLSSAFSTWIPPQKVFLQERFSLTTPGSHCTSSSHP